MFFTIASMVLTGIFRYDFLMPAELFLFTLAGSIGLAVIGLLLKLPVKKLLFAFLLCTAAIFGAQAYALITGLAQGETELTGIHLIIMSISVALWHFFDLWIILESFATVRKIRKAV